MYCQEHAPSEMELLHVSAPGHSKYVLVPLAEMHFVALVVEHEPCVVRGVAPLVQDAVRSRYWNVEPPPVPLTPIGVVYAVAVTHDEGTATPGNELVGVTLNRVESAELVVPGARSTVVDGSNAAPASVGFVLMSTAPLNVSVPACVLFPVHGVTWDAG